jgi:hypothetical protein
MALAILIITPPPMPPGNFRELLEPTQQVRQIGQVMFAYATDNRKDYPDGNSSTEVFQKFLDQGYVNDPAIFYIPFPGKKPAEFGQKLKPENVCWDVTSGVDSHAPDGLPLVFMTGYKVTYAPGASAVPLIKPYPPYGSLSWQGRWRLPWWPGEYAPRPGASVFYKGNRAVFMKLEIPANSDASIPNFVSPQFDSKGKTYRQLTPDGPLPGN